MSRPADAPDAGRPDDRPDGLVERLPVLEREAARVLLLDGAGRVLLIQGHDPAVVDGERWWFTPGGGLEPGESLEQAARRELWEETGLHVDELEGPVAERTTTFPFDGLLYRQHELYLVGRVAGTDVEVRPTAHTDLELRSVLRWRWWTVEELLATTEQVHPEWLAAVVSRSVTEVRTNRYRDESPRGRHDP